MELANGLLYLAVALRDGPTLRALVDMAFVTALLVLSLIDLDHQILPNVITLPGIAVGLLASVALGGWEAGLRSALAAAAGYLAFWAIAAAYRRTRGVEGLGQGDWKLAAMLGAFLGWERMLVTILLASILGTIVGVALMVTRARSSQHPLPLGTFLGLAGIAVLFVGQPLVDWYAPAAARMSVRLSRPVAPGRWPPCSSSAPSTCTPPPWGCARTRGSASARCPDCGRRPCRRARGCPL